MKNQTTVSPPLQKNIIALLCFLLSGFTALAYEIAWIRKSSLIFGTTTLAVSTVFGVFFGGLALGSYIFGRISKKTTTPLKIYAFLEIGIGILAVLNPAFFYLGESLYSVIYPYSFDNFAALTILRFLLTTLIILPPTILMGGTLPLFTRHFTRSQNKISYSIGQLYALNTMGGVLGVVITGFILIPVIGVTKSIILCAVINILIGILIIYQKTESLPEETEITSRKKKTKHSQKSQTTPIIIATLFFITGFIALGNEIIWSRYLTLLIHNTVYTYVITLTVVLSGIVIGSFIISFFSDRADRQLLFAILNLFIGISVLFVMRLPVNFWQGFIDTQSSFNLIIIAMIIFFIPALLSGMTFPIAVGIFIKNVDTASLGTGKMTAYNTFGGILGSICMGFLILPLAGIQTSIYISTILSMLTGITALIFLEKKKSPGKKILIVVSAIVLWIAIPFLLKTKVPKDFLQIKHTLIDFREGLNSFISVVDNKEKNDIELQINRLWQGSKEKTHQVLAAHVPVLFHQAPENVLVVGIGVGQTAKSFLYHDIKRLDCVDIEKELFDIIKKHFDAGWMDNKRTNIIIEDGRNYISHTDKQYDIISIEIGQIFRPNLSSFYTKNFYEEIKAKLNDDGIASQFIALAFLEEQELKSAIRTFIEVFPETILWFNQGELLLLGSKSTPLILTQDRLSLLNTNIPVKEDLDFFLWGGENNKVNKTGVFTAGYICNTDKLRDFTANASIYTDDVPKLEYITARKQKYIRENIEKTLLELINHLDDPARIIDFDLSEGQRQTLKYKQKTNLTNIITLDYLSLYFETGNPDYIYKAFNYNPDNSEACFQFGTLLTKQNKMFEAQKAFERTISINPNHVYAHNNLGLILSKSNPDAAITHYIKAIQLKPDYYKAYNNLGISYGEKGDLHNAIYNFKKALDIKPDFKEATDNLNYATNLLNQQ